jgi:DNA-binding protein H-NS
MGMSERLNLDVMSAEGMWQLHEEISQLLAVRLTSEKRQLEKRLAQLRGGKGMRQSEPSDAQSLESEPRAQRKYPQVFPKYRNPKEPSETWSGRGKQPRLLAAALKTGHVIEEFVISNAESNKSNENNKNNWRRVRE